MKIRKSASSLGTMTTATGTASSSSDATVAASTSTPEGATGGLTNASRDDKASTSDNRRGSSGATSHVLSGFGILKKKSISGMLH